MIALLSTLALAHGPAAATLAVLATDDLGPTMVSLTEGIGVRSDEGWEYVCPARWGGLPLAPFAAASADGVWIPGADALYHLAPDGSATPVGPADLAVGGLLAIADGASPLALYVGGDGRRLVRLDDQTELWAEAGDWSGLTEVGTTIHLARERDGVLEHLALDQDGVETSRIDEGPIEGTNPLLRAVGDQLWAIDRSSGRSALIALPGTTVIWEALDAVQGPAAVGDGVVFGGDGALYWVADPPAPTGETAGVGCLTARGGETFACSRSLYALSPEGTVVRPAALPLDDLLPPSLDGLEGNPATECWGQWRQFASDIGIEAGDLPGATPPPVAEPEGCGCQSGGSATLGPAALLAVALLRRQSRRTGSPSAFQAIIPPDML